MNLAHRHGGGGGGGGGTRRRLLPLGAARALLLADGETENYEEARLKNHPADGASNRRADQEPSASLKLFTCAPLSHNACESS